MRHERTVIGYHGCDVSVAERLLAGEPFAPSDNNFDWLGRGVYFWEYGADRALRFAHDQVARGKVTVPVVVGAVLQLGECFDLLDTHYTHELTTYFPMWETMMLESGLPLPENAGDTPDHKLRRLDCAVLNWLFDTYAERATVYYDSVRGGFSEGESAFRGSGIQRETHVQVAIRNPSCILVHGGGNLPRVSCASASPRGVRSSRRACSPCLLYTSDAADE